MTTAAIYARVSTTDQAGAEKTSLQTQLEAARAYCAERGYLITGEYLDVHSGGDLWERPQLNALREQIRAGRVTIALAYAIDRLSRRQVHLGVLLDEAERHGARYEFVTEALDQTSTGTFLASARTFAAELEREKILERTMRGKRARLDAGKPMRSRPAYGYTWDAEGRVWVVREDQAAIVRRIFAEVAAGLTLHAISIALTEEGVPTPAPGRRWWSETLGLIVRNPMYSGQMAAHRWNGVKGKPSRRDSAEWIAMPASAAPALVSREIWERAQERVAGNKKYASRNNRHAEDFLLRLLVYCGACGRRMWTGMDRRDTLFYRCGRFDACDSRTRVSARWLDAAVWAEVVAWSQAPLRNRPARLRSPATKALADVAGAEAALQRLLREQGRIVAAVTKIDAAAQGPLLAALEDNQRKVAAAQEKLAEAQDAAEVVREPLSLAYLLPKLAPLIADPNLPHAVKRDILTAQLPITVRVYLPDAPERYVIEGLGEY